jgi:hypothetical protein
MSAAGLKGLDKARLRRPIRPDGAAPDPGERLAASRVRRSRTAEPAKV